MTDAPPQTLLQVADDFIDQVITSACKLAKLRQASQLDIRDLQIILERNYNIRVPGYASDELRTVKKIQPTQAWTQKLSAVQVRVFDEFICFVFIWQHPQILLLVFCREHDANYVHLLTSHPQAAKVTGGRTDV